MFERYTEKARRVIFFARYEASQFGSPYIETEHLLLGILREDKALTNRFLRSHAAVESIRKNIEAHTTIREKLATSVDLPLSNESKRVLAYAAEESKRLKNKNIGPEHLLLGLMREEKCFAMELLTERGLNLATVRDDLASAPHVPGGQASPESKPQGDSLRDITQAAIDGQMEPVVGRDTEIDAMIAILATHRRRNPILIGERGSGKTAIVEGLALRIADGHVPAGLAEKRILAVAAAQVAVWVKGKLSLTDLTIGGKASENLAEIILFLDDLDDLLAAAAKAGASNAAGMLAHVIEHGGLQCIAACSPDEFRELAQSAPRLAEQFRPVQVRPLDDKGTLAVLQARKASLEKFHGVTYADEAIEFAVRAAANYLPADPMPEKALELLDAAGARVKLRQAAPPAEIAEVQKRIRFISQRFEAAIANHEFEKARFYSEEERKQRENLRLIKEGKNIEDESAIVGRKEMEEVIASWGEYPFKS
jgi:ATP-dependent Clp protease ATP-binding subunit ClpC